MSHRQATGYVGFTQTTLSQRLVSHRQNGSIHDHFKEFHNIKPTRDHLTGNTKIIARAKDRKRLAIREALLILDEKPIINKQYDNFSNVLKLHQSRSDPKKMGTLKTREENLENICSPPCTQPESIPNLNHSPHLLDFSPRTKHLLTSPIRLDLMEETPVLHSDDSLVMATNKVNVDIPNLENLNEEVNMNTTPHTIPDMTVVLKGFGIDPDKLSYVSLDEDLEEELPSPNSLSISQRIHTLSRKCKKGYTNRRSQE